MLSVHCVDTGLVVSALVWTRCELVRLLLVLPPPPQSVGLPLLKDLWQGFNVCFITYGASGSGKSHSMFGRHMSWDASRRPVGAAEGVLPRVLRSLYQLGECRNCLQECDESLPGCTGRPHANTNTNAPRA
jgi:hypothetical protein